MYRVRAKAKKRLERQEAARTGQQSARARLAELVGRVPAPDVARIVGRESAYVVRMAGTYAYGLTDHAARLAGSVARLPDQPERNMPVLLLHGIAHNHSWSLRMQTDLRLVGFRTYAINYSTFGQGSITGCTADVVAQIANLQVKLGAPRLHVIGHSLGGLVIRDAINEYEDLRPSIATVITLGAPHHGTPIAWSWTARVPILGGLFRDMSCDSDTIRRLDDRANPGEAKWTSIWSPEDEFVPGNYGELRHPAYHAASVRLRGLGHYGLTYDPRALDAIRDILIDSDEVASPE